MKTGSLVASALVLGMIATSAMAQTPGTNVFNSKHNLSSVRGTDGDIYVLGTQSSNGNTDSDTTQVCVFCHTPHGANNNISVPLWNKTNSQTSYNAYTMKGRDSLGTAVTTGNSVACLTCHDGTQAMDAFMNAPGLHVNPTDQTGKSAGFEWNGQGGAGTATVAGGDVGDGTGGTIKGALNAARYAGQTETGPVLGTDMSNDHPIGMTYCGKQTTVGTCDGNNATAFVSPALVGASPIKLFSRTGRKQDNSLTGGNLNGTVECASCHNPHGTGNQAFLRVPRTGSAICLACHVK